MEDPRYAPDQIGKVEKLLDFLSPKSWRVVYDEKTKSCRMRKDLAFKYLQEEDGVKRIEKFKGLFKRKIPKQTEDR